MTCFGLFAWPTYVMALIVISFGLNLCWLHGLILVGWTVFMLSINLTDLNPCQSATTNRTLPTNVAEFIAQPGLAAPNSEELSVKETPKPPSGQSKTNTELPKRTLLETLTNRIKEKIKNEVSESSTGTRLEEIQDRVKVQLSRVKKWLGESPDVSAEKVEKGAK
jgi:hypothetical protein